MTTATGKATVKFSEFKDGPKPNFGGTVTLKKKVNDITFTAALSDQTLQGATELKDVVLTAEKSLGSGLKAHLEYNAGKKATKVTTTWKNEAEDVTLKGVWSEKDSAFKGEATMLLDSQNKVAATYEFPSKKSTATWTRMEGKSDVGVRYDFGKSSYTLIANTKQGKDAYKVELDASTRGVALEYSRKPYKLVGKGKLTSNGVTDLSVAATYEYVIEF